MVIIICLLNLLNSNLSGTKLASLAIMEYLYFRKKSLKIAIKDRSYSKNIQGNIIKVSARCKPYQMII